MSFLCAVALLLQVSAAQVTSEVTVAQAPDDVRAWLADHERSIRLSPDVLSADLVGRDGACALLDVTTRGVVDTFSYRIRRCPTAHGFREDFVSSAEYEAIAGDWQILSAGSGARVIFTLAVEMKSSLVPDWLLGRSMQSSVNAITDRVRSAFQR